MDEQKKLNNYKEWLRQQRVSLVFRMRDALLGLPETALPVDWLQATEEVLAELEVVA